MIITKLKIDKIPRLNGIKKMLKIIIVKNELSKMPKIMLKTKCSMREKLFMAFLNTF